MNGQLTHDPFWDRVPPTWPDPGSRLRAWARRPHAFLGSGIVLLVLANVALRGWVAWGASFWEDDYLYLADAQQGLTLDYLTQDYSGHLQVGQFFVVWVLARLAPLSHPVAAAGILALSALAVALFARLLLVVCGSSRDILVPLAVYALCPVALNATTWWAAAIQAIPLQIAMILTVDAHVRHTQTGRRRWLLLAIGSFVLGLLFWEKALLILPLVAGLTMLVLRPAGGNGVLRQLRPQAWLWVAYGSLAAVYATVFVRITDSTGSRVDLPTTLQAFRIGALDTFTVGLAGGPWRAEGRLPITLSAAPHGSVLIVALILGAAVLVVSVRWRGAYAVRVWLLLLGYLATDLGLLAVTRLDFIGAELARDPRYVTDAIPVAALCLALILMPGRASVASAPALRDAPAGRPILLTSLLLAYLASCLITTGAVARHGSAHSAAGYLDTLRGSLAADPDAQLVDGPVPIKILSSLFAERSGLSTVTTAMGLDRTYGAPAEHLLIADLQGRLRPVDLKDPVRSARGPVRGCGWEARGPDGVVVALPQPAGGVVRLGYFVGESVRAVVETAGRRHDVVLLEGLHDLYVPLPPGVLAADVTLSGLPAGVNACLGVVSVGPAEPRP